MRIRAAVAVVALAALAACFGPDRSARKGEGRANYRRTHREYDGSPPVIPHAVAALGREDCLGCHREGMDLGKDGIAPQAPHPERVNCQQCHVEQVEGKPVLVANSFDGLRHPAAGTRAYPGAPPTVPHPRNGRENCIGCHGASGGSPIRTPHPDRVNCLQCHVTQDAAAEPFDDASLRGKQ